MRVDQKPAGSARAFSSNYHIKIIWSGPMTINGGSGSSQAQRIKAVLQEMKTSVRVEPMDAAGNHPNIEASEQPLRAQQGQRLFLNASTVE